MSEMPPEGRQGPIEVDVKILQDESIRRLEEFGKQFDKSAQQILQGLERLANVSGDPTGPSASASTPGRTASQMRAGAVAGAVNGGGSNATVAGAAGGGIPGRPDIKGPATGFAGMGFAGPNISEYQRAQLRLGQFPSYGAAQGLMAASWMTGAAGWRRATDQEKANGVGDDGEMLRHDPEGQVFARRAGLAGTLGTHASTAFGVLGQGVMRVQQMLPGGIIGLFSGGQTTLAGQQAGESRAGSFGMGVFSPAWRHGMGMRLGALKQSWFGFNPNYSKGEAMAAQQAIQESGYGVSGGPYGAGWLASQMRSLQQSQMMDPQTAMAFLDPALRFGGANPKQVANELKTLGDTAKAARLGLGQLTASLVSTAQGISGQTGIQMSTVMESLKNMSATTGLDPSALQGMFDSHNLILGTYLTGKQPWQTMYSGQGLAQAASAMPMRILQSAIGATPDQLRHDPALKHQAMNRVAMIYAQNPQAFGGLSPIQAFNMYLRGNNPFKAAQAISDVEQAGSRSDVLRGIHEFGGARSRHIAELYSSHKINQHEAANRLRQAAGSRNKEAANQITMTLTPEARKLLKFMNDNPSERNKGDSGWHKALSIGEDVARVGLSHLPGPAGAVGGAIAGLF